VFCYLSTCVVFVFVCLRILGCVLLNMHLNKKGLICNITNLNSIGDSHSTVAVTSAKASAFGSALFTCVRV